MSVLATRGAHRRNATVAHLRRLEEIVARRHAAWLGACANGSRAYAERSWLRLVAAQAESAHAERAAARGEAR